ncbi:CopG family transcriptional regulator [Rhizobium sp. CC-YZS058]|uniref:CopG family transcriptional regulator n=1 Tax=Rhizobium sp. CC-YZS058 TaxID=3042153 RepID=UPI002B05CEC1|nr:CopG family transcriptional regulator [Rhizobium sp. CC-YZS058]MEA3534967.1 CopG family transcriptional regulator [Rhizobium sp. CC-YZS058]
MNLVITINEDTATLLKSRADLQSSSLETFVSELLEREALAARSFETRNGVPLLPPRGDGTTITLDLVNALRDDAE